MVALLPFVEEKVLLVVVVVPLGVADLQVVVVVSLLLLVVGDILEWGIGVENRLLLYLFLEVGQVTMNFF